MKKLLITLITILPFMAYSDTLDYWAVYLNDSLIGNFNSASTENEFEIKYNSIKDSDTISIVYGNDHPCQNCEYYFALKELNSGQKIYVERRKEIQQKVSFPLIEIKKFKGFGQFEIFVHENSNIDNNDNFTQLLRLKLE